MQSLSKVFGTEIELDGDTGLVRLPVQADR
jgi:hypothetical protein